jgi:nitrate/TMAO reductase-like tetraheme cytochrome c subunit
LAATLLAGGVQVAQADREVFNVANPVYREECGSCHVPYPPQLLPKASWQAIMAGLDKHFGSDASLDAKTVKDIQVYLEFNASRRAASGKPPLRITESAWFKREHDEVAASVWKSAAVKSAANCAACHTQADQGDYSERTLRVPK